MLAAAGVGKLLRFYYERNVRATCTSDFSVHLFESAPDPAAITGSPAVEAATPAWRLPRTGTERGD